MQHPDDDWESQLIRGLRDEDPAAWEEFNRRYAAQVRREAAKELTRRGVRFEPKDLSSIRCRSNLAFFVRVRHGILDTDKAKAAPRGLFTLLATIVRYEVLTFRRERARRVNVDVEDLAEESEGRGPHVDSTFRAESIGQIIDDALRAVVNARSDEGRITMMDIRLYLGPLRPGEERTAQDLGASYGKSATQVSRIRERVRERVRQEIARLIGNDLSPADVRALREDGDVLPDARMSSHQFDQWLMEHRTSRNRHEESAPDART